MSDVIKELKEGVWYADDFGRDYSDITEEKKAGKIKPVLTDFGGDKIPEGVFKGASKR